MISTLIKVVLRKTIAEQEVINPAVLLEEIGKLEIIYHLLFASLLPDVATFGEDQWRAHLLTETGTWKDLTFVLTFGLTLAFNVL